MKNAIDTFILELNNVFKNRQSQLIQFAYSYVRDREDAEDIVMTAFTNVWSNRDALQTHTNIMALLLTTVKNLSLNFLDHKLVRSLAEENISLMRQKELNLRITSLEACDPTEILCNEIQTLITNSINELPENSRQIFILSRLENLSNKEIADKLKLSVKTVEFHITRSLKYLRLKLKDYSYLCIFF